MMGVKDGFTELAWRFICLVLSGEEILVISVSVTGTYEARLGYVLCCIYPAFLL